jgi:hypothetical protein
MVTSSNSSAFPNSAAWFTTNDGSGAQGYTSLRACVNAAGFGYNGRVSQPCDAGSYNAADTYGTCTQCGVGLTTRGVGLGVTASDCGLAAGYGWSAADSATMPCPAGERGAAWGQHTPDAQLTEADPLLLLASCPNHHACHTHQGPTTTIRSRPTARRSAPAARRTPRMPT